MQRTVPWWTSPATRTPCTTPSQEASHRTLERDDHKVEGAPCGEKACHRKPERKRKPLPWQRARVLGACCLPLLLSPAAPKSGYAQLVIRIPIFSRRTVRFSQIFCKPDAKCKRIRRPAGCHLEVTSYQFSTSRDQASTLTPIQRPPT